MSLSGKKIVLGVSASIAAYKAVLLLRLLVKAGAEVKVVLTPDVERFVGSLTFGALTNGQVLVDLWGSNWSEHVALGTWADLMVVAPATANTLAKMAHGQCDNALLAVYLAARCPVMVAPAMDADMYIHPRTQANLASLSQDGVQVLPVGQGFLASGLEGPGRLLEPADILQAVAHLLGEGPLTGKKVLITAGPTREALDPVRYLTNHSSGKMGYALAAVAQQWGATVHLVSGPVSLTAPIGVQVHPATSAQDMYKAVMPLAPEMDIMIMAAAVADYTPAFPADRKIKKKGDDFTLEMKKTPDILRSVGQIKQPGQLLVGFALETNDALANARKKLVAKNLDFVVLNTLEDAGAGFGHDTNKVTLVDAVGEQSFPLKSKKEVAADIWSRIISLQSAS